MSVGADGAMCAELYVDCESSKFEEGLVSDVEKLSMQETASKQASLPVSCL